MTQHAARSTQHAARSTQHAARSTQHAAALFSLIGVLLAGCGGKTDETLGRASLAVGGGDVTPGDPESVANVVFGNGSTGSGPPGAVENHCTATVIQLDSPPLGEPSATEFWLLTAAHCLGGDLYPPDADNTLTIAFASGNGHGQTDQVNRTGAPNRIFIHPQARGDDIGDISWTRRFDPDKTDCAHDLALIRLSPGRTLTPARVYHFGCSGYNAACQDDLAGVPGDFGGVAATGHLHAGDMALQAGSFCSFGSDPVIAANASHAVAEPGDSGGGLFVTAPTPSQPHAMDFCDELPVADHGETALVGVTSKVTTDGSATFFTPIYLPAYSPYFQDHACDATRCPSNGDWIYRTMRFSHDSDGLCDEVDNCPDTDNPDQANSNADAEAAWTGRGPIGDACDPAPTPLVSLSGSAQVVPVQNTRAIADQIGVQPIPETDTGGSTVVSAAHGLFCLCRNVADGSPIADKSLCKEGPWFCDLKPYYGDRMAFSEVPTPPRTQASLAQGQTTWHFISADEPGTLCPPYQDCTLDHHFTMAYPGPAHEATWLYQADNARWNSLGYFDTVPVAPDPAYPPGTDLGGEIWMHDGTTAGNYAHGLPVNVPCTSTTGYCALGNVADSYQFGVAPDRKVAGLTQHFDFGAVAIDVPIGGTASSETSFLAGEHPLQPLPVLTIDPATSSSSYWLSRGRRFTADAVLSAQLREELVEPSLHWVGASEPASLTQSAALPRAVAVARDGSTLVDALVRTDTGYRTLAEAGEVAGEAPLAAAATTSAGAAGPPPRAGFGATLSRLTGVLSIVGGHDATGRAMGDIWTARSDGWHHEALFGAAPPASVEAATYSWKDERVWLVDAPERRRHPGPPTLALYRIEPETGWIESRERLTGIGWAQRIWLTTTEDGRVLLTAAGHDRWLVARLSTRDCRRAAARHPRRGACRRNRIAVDGFQTGRGHLVAPPRILYERVTGAFERRAPGGRILDVRFLADLRNLQHGHCELDADLE